MEGKIKMKSHALFGVLTITAAFAMNGHAQVYQLSTPLSGYLTMSAQDLNGPTGSSAGFQFNFTNLTETVYLDPVAETIRQVGVISGTPTATNISFQETQSVPGQFPNSPTNVSGSVTVTLAPTSGVVSFDTGALPLTWNAGSGAYTFDGNLPNLGDFSGSYSLVTGGQTYSGSFTYELLISPWPPYSGGWFNVFTFNTVSTTGYPNSLSLSGLGLQSPYFGALFTASPNVVADVVATNGYHADLSVGAQTIVSEVGVPLGEVFGWTSPGTIIATLVATSNSPVITAEPQSVTVYAHDNTSFSVIASGTIPLSYQWSLNGTNIIVASLSSFTIANVAQTNLGEYAVVVTNGVGSVTSSNATLSMYPFIEAPFQGAITYWGQTNTLSVGAWGTGPLYYQWFNNGVAIDNATNQTLTLASIQATNAGLYSVVVSSALGSVTNPPAQVIVQPAGVSLGFCPSVTINGVIGYSYIIERTADLTDTNSWVTLTNLTLTQPVQLWVDTSVDTMVPANAKYFYRVLAGQ